MNPIKKIIIEETAKVLREMKHGKKVKDIASNLYEAVKTADLVKNNPKKYKLAKKLVAISENKLIKERQRLKENHQYEDESEMAKAQLAAIIEKSNELLRMMENVTQLEDWLQYKLSIAENYIDAIHGYIKYFNGETDMEDNRMEDDMENDEMGWDDVEEEDYDEDAEYFDDEDEEDFDGFDDSDFEDEYEDFDEDDEEFTV
jgi:hypothetical protein